MSVFVSSALADDAPSPVGGHSYNRLMKDMIDWKQATMLAFVRKYFVPGQYWGNGREDELEISKWKSSNFNFYDPYWW